MIKVNCTAPDTGVLSNMVPFQGDLKKRSSKDIEELKASILTEGLMMPFALWKNDDKYMILDGHGRYAALISAALSDPSILTQEFPVILISANNEDDARKALLQITSTYGKVSKSGVLSFTASIPNYKAPIISKVSKVITPVNKERLNDLVIVRIRIPKEKAPDLTRLLQEVNWIEIY